jgi:drug/metabolite transporter (DMT)-like permease
MNTATEPVLRLRFPRLVLTSESMGWAALIGMLLAGSTYNSFAKVLTESITPLSLVFVSECLTFLFVILSYGLLPTARALFHTKNTKKVALLGIGIASGFIAPALLFTGLQNTGAVNATLFGNTEMLFLLVLALIFLRERLQGIHFVSMTAILIGLVIISFRGFTVGLTLQRGDLFLILASFSYSIGDLLFRKYLHETPTEVIIFSRAIIAMTGFVILSAVWPQPIIAEIKAFPLELVWILLAFAFISRFLNITFFYQSLDRLPVATVSLFSNLSIIFAIIFANWFLNESIYGYQVFGGAFIILGTLLLEAVGSHHPSPAHHEAHLRHRA